MKVPYNISVEDDDLDTVREFCQKARVPMSYIIEPYFSGIAHAMRAKGYLKKDRISKLDIFKLLGSNPIPDL